MSSTTIYFPGLNGLRAIAAIAVVISHITLGLSSFGLDAHLFGTFADGKPKGLSLAGFGVSIFFVLNGLYLLLPIGIQVMIIIFKLLKITPNGSPVGLAQTLIYSTGAFIISLIISYLSYHYLETYFLRLKEKFATEKAISVKL